LTQFTNEDTAITGTRVSTSSSWPAQGVTKGAGSSKILALSLHNLVKKISNAILTRILFRFDPKAGLLIMPCPFRLMHRGKAIMTTTPPIAVIMGSTSDWPTMKYTGEILDELEITYEAKIISAHRTPDRLVEFSRAAADSGYQVIIAGAGGAAHLPGMVASMTRLPVLGVPVQSRTLLGLDSLMSIVQMPGGVPVGTLAIGRFGAKNAGLLAASILALSDADVAGRLEGWRARQADSVAESPTG